MTVERFETNLLVTPVRVKTTEPQRERNDTMDSGPSAVVALLPLLFMLVIFAVSIAGLVLWVWMLVDCATKERGEGNDKLIWILVIVLTGWIGALIYLLVRRPKRKALFGE